MFFRSPLSAAMRFFFATKAMRPRPSDSQLVARIHDSAAKLSRLPDAALLAESSQLRQRAQVGEAVISDEVLQSAFAIVVAAARRALAIDLYDVQLLGGIALARGAIAEMQTGEGKTFTTLAPAYVHALAGHGVHVMTNNPYLAKRDFDQLAPVYGLLGLSVGLIEDNLPPGAKRSAYESDITFGPGYEFGFDYLRDQVALISRSAPRLGDSFRARQRGASNDDIELMQRGHAVAIVDEADSVMLDEATTPLILAAGGDGPAPNADVYETALRIATRLELERHFVIDRASSTLRLTACGCEQLAAWPDQIPRRGLARSWTVYVEQALRAEYLFRRDVHYVVDGDAIRLVDQYTGRIFTDRSWNDGLHQAVQAKEGITITTETSSNARITRQRYLRLYRHLCGMTGTAQGAERELLDVYGKQVVVIPPHRPCRRTILPTLFFADATRKEQAIVEELVTIHRTGQPVLVGTAAIETSLRLAERLDERGISYQLLNGIQDAEEAEIVARAGQLGAVTIATNMAGRGTDIKLGRGVRELGGLHVIATEPQESTRVDRQLVGRAARQGDPGSCRQFVAANDELFTRFAPSLSARIRRLAGRPGSCQAKLAHEVAALQYHLEQTRARQRRQLFAHDDWMESILRELT